MKSSYLVIAAMSLGLATSVAFADIDIMSKMENVKGKIEGLDKTLAQAKKESGVPVEFPAFIPKSKQDKKYYASNDANAKSSGFSYMINVDSTPDCNGVKYCNVGVFSAKTADKPDMMTDRNNKVITKSVMLADGTTAYYTPGHAMGDYFPATIQWTDNKQLYSISWNSQLKLPEVEKAALITMANSAKNPGSG